MSISIKELNKQISVISLDIKKNDYNEKLKSILNDYRKKANIPGFRKGFVPLGLIKKQYEIPVKVDEINKLVQYFSFSLAVRVVLEAHSDWD